MHFFCPKNFGLDLSCIKSKHRHGEEKISFHLLEFDITKINTVYKKVQNNNKNCRTIYRLIYVIKSFKSTTQNRNFSVKKLKCIGQDSTGGDSRIILNFTFAVVECTF